MVRRRSIQVGAEEGTDNLAARVIRNFAAAGSSHLAEAFLDDEVESPSVKVVNTIRGHPRDMVRRRSIQVGAEEGTDSKVREGAGDP
jgi:hypothetical protein